MVWVVPAPQTSPPIGDVNRATSIVKALSDLSTPLIFPSLSIPFTLIRQFLRFFVGLGTVVHSWVVPVSPSAMNFHVPPPSVEYSTLYVRSEARSPIASHSIE